MKLAREYWKGIWGVLSVKASVVPEVSMSRQVADVNQLPILAAPRVLYYVHSLLLSRLAQLLLISIIAVIYQDTEYRMASENGGVLHWGTSDRKEKRKPSRRDPEKRRQQNAQAQRKYRKALLSDSGTDTHHLLGEKLRKRLDQLEAIAASGAPAFSTEGTPATATRPPEGATGDSSSCALLDSSIIKFPAYGILDIPVSSSSAVIPEECQFPQELENSLSALSPWDLATDPQSNDDHSWLRVWDSTKFVHPSLLICDIKKDSHCPYWTATVSCGCSTPHVQIRTQGPDPSCYGDIKILSIEPGAPAADPCASQLRIETVCTISALHAIGTHVGITEELICADDSLSPFFRFTVDSADDTAKNDMICAVQRIFTTLKPDLRPTKEQITIRHHPFIDILPSPTLRKNLIKHQDELDEDEFFHDMLIGLVCWGGAGVGRRDRNLSTSYASTGTPWDVRSWEARDWFIKKYWRLLGGEDGELVRQSEWWRSIRGEDSLDVEARQVTEAT